MSSACKTKSQEPSAHEASAHACAKCVMRDKSKIEESDESHLRWGGEAENSLGEGQEACVLPTFEVQARSAGLHERGAGVHPGSRRARHLQQNLEENKSPHNRAGHLRQAATNDQGKQERSPYIFANLRTYKPTPVAQSWAIMSREANQEEQTLGARGGKRDLAFASRTMSSPRSFAVLSGT